MTTPPHFKFSLYVADDSPNGAEAIANLKAICLQYLPDRHTIEIIDVFQVPERATADGIRMTPTLVRTSPAPVLRLVGTLSEATIVLESMELGILAA
jgi:circadian clock protein KaiB